VDKSQSSIVQGLLSFGFGTDKLLPLSVAIIGGLVLITLILYPFPNGVFAGIVEEIGATAVELIIPIFTGFEKLPDELLNWATNELLAAKDTLLVKLTVTGEPAQKTVRFNAEVLKLDT
jgi:hypothetical protein